MNLKRTITISVAGGAVAVWIAAAATSNTRTVAPIVPAKPTVVDKSGAALAVEVRRLHERLRPTDTPSDARNLFRYASRSSAMRLTPAPPSAAAAPVVAAPAPAQVLPLKLEGLAEEQGADGLVRTAIISGSGDLFLVKEGDSVTPRYRVAKISSEAVELTDLTDNTPVRLALR